MSLSALGEWLFSNVERQVKRVPSKLSGMHSRPLR